MNELRKSVGCVPQTREAKLVLVLRERAGNARGEEQRRDLTDHGQSVPPRLSTRNFGRGGKAEVT